MVVYSFPTVTDGVPLSPNNTYDVLYNNESHNRGDLLEDFTPAVNPDKEIDDPEDKKPEDWVDEKKISDPEATKPEDWDEDAPYEIVDEEAVKPEGWLDDEPEFVPDPGKQSLTLPFEPCLIQ